SMINFLFIFILLCITQHSIVMMLQTSRIVSNKSFHIEEYGTVKFDCLIEQNILAAWLIGLRHDNIYR
ncbi:unnamed protein product, partial [Rotaria sp. Silwood2]